MKKRITFTFAAEWLKAHQADKGQSPIPFFIKKMYGEYLSKISIVKRTATELVFGFDDEKVSGDDITSKIKMWFGEQYPDDVLADALTTEIGSGEPKNVAPVVTTAPDQPAAQADPGPKPLAPAAAPVTPTEAPAAETPAAPAPAPAVNPTEAPAAPPVNSALEKVKGEIEAMIGGESFALLAGEIETIAPQIIRNNTFDTFTYQSYLFAINDGYGLSSYLSMLADLISALKIKRPATTRTVIEAKLAPPKGDSKEPFDEITKLLHRGQGDCFRILCVDISEWMHQVKTRIFKEFLVEVEKYLSEYILVFRIPYVDDEVVSSIKNVLSDVLYVRTVIFPPFTREQIQKCADQTLTRYGFEMSAHAWDSFHDRIFEEKSDGKFHGRNTVDKVVRELLYKKQLDNARRGTNDTLVTKQDSDKLPAEPGSSSLTGEQMLARMVGGDKIKARVDEIISQIEFARQSEGMKTPCIHMRFVGNPGTGKTTVARIIGKILKERGVLRVGNFHEYAGRDFCGRYIGETAPKTAGICRDAYGSVLFIDEAYSLYRGADNDRDFGREALDTLIAEMENHRSDLVVIMAGYTDEMETLMKGNAGLASRMPYVIEFPNFTKEELYQIYTSMLTDNFPYDEDLLPAVKQYFDELSDDFLKAKEFSNGRFVRNLFERTWAKASMRTQAEQTGRVVLKQEDFTRAIADKEFALNAKKKPRIGFLD